MFNGGFVFDYPLGGKGPHQNRDYWGIIIIISNNIIYHGVNSFFFFRTIYHGVQVVIAVYNSEI